MTTFVLVPGAWLGAEAWRDVTARLEAAGHEVHPVTLSGIGERASTADLDTHVADLIDLIDKLHRPVLVAHSYGGLPASVVASRIPDQLARVVYVDSGALPEGMSQFDSVPPEQQEADRARVVDGMLPPPSFDGFDEAIQRRLRADARPHPFASLVQPVRYEPDAKPVPVTLIACTFSPEQVAKMTAEGHPFFARMAGAEVVGLNTTEGGAGTGAHWPMYGEPERLAVLLSEL